ncbi:hypothetical protein CF54_18270 [Streptomyces sp. Tu 6176]|nr:hypothetical protein CF54_18270 [Streptomyces sp. Tu 6176]
MTVTLVSAAPVPLVSVVVASVVWPGWITGAVFRARTSLTTITMEPVTPPTVTLMVVTPSEAALTTPEELTVATAGSLLAYWTVVLDRSVKVWSLLTASTMSSAVIEVSRCSLAGSVSSLIHGFFFVRSRVSPAWKTTRPGWTVTVRTLGVRVPVMFTVAVLRTVAESEATRSAQAPGNTVCRDVAGFQTLRSAAATGRVTWIFSPGARTPVFLKPTRRCLGSVAPETVKVLAA